MITPNDHISQLVSYFSGPSTSGAVHHKIKSDLLIIMKGFCPAAGLTNIVRSVAGSLKGFFGKTFFGKTKISQLENTIQSYPILLSS